MLYLYLAQCILFLLNYSLLAFWLLSNSDMEWSMPVLYFVSMITNGFMALILKRD